MNKEVAPRQPDPVESEEGAPDDLPTVPMPLPPQDEGLDMEIDDE